MTICLPPSRSKEKDFEFLFFSSRYIARQIFSPLRTYVTNRVADRAIFEAKIDARSAKLPRVTEDSEETNFGLIIFIMPR